MKRFKADKICDGHSNTNAITTQYFATKNAFNDRGDKNNGRGDIGGTIFFQVTKALASPSREKRKKKSSLPGISQTYILMNPSQITQAQKSHISKLK